MRKFPKGSPAAWIRQVATPGQIVIDGGANKGEFSMAAAETVGPTGTVYAIEPDPRCVPLLQTVMHDFPQVKHLPYALDRSHGHAPMTLGHNSEQSSLIRAAVADVFRIDEVQTIPLDAVTSERVAAVKLDLQGGEPAALAGASELLTTCPAWCVEFWPWALHEQAAFLLTVFQALDFKAHTFDGAYVDYAELLAWSYSQLEPHQHINILFSR